MSSPASSLTPSDPGSLPSPSTENISSLIRSWGLLLREKADKGRRWQEKIPCRQGISLPPLTSPRLAALRRACRWAALPRGALLGLVLVEHRLGRGLTLGAELGAVVAAPLE